MIQTDPLPVVGHVLECLGRTFAAAGPERVRVRVVAFPGDAIDAHAVAHLDAEVVFDEATVDVLLEQITRRVLLMLL